MNEIYDLLKEHFSKNNAVQLPGAKGAQGLKHNGKMFAMFYKGDLTVKLAPERVQEIIAAGEGEPHDPGTGKPMKDRVLIRADRKETWILFCEESLDYVSR